MKILISVVNSARHCIRHIAYIISLRYNWISVNTFGASQVMFMVKNPPASVGDVRDMSSISGLGRSFGGRHSNPL